jgi:nucleoid-associated protein YgaU
MKQNEFLELPKLSLYRYENFFNIYEDSSNNFKYYNILRSINLIPSTGTDAEESYTVKYNDTWLLISYKYYNTMDLWWLVCAYNQIKNPTKMPEPGTLIKLLKPSFVGMVIEELLKQISR